ncbi:MAG: formyltransferase family protein [Anaerolineae bacterium]
MRVLFFGMDGRFSVPPLLQLLGSRAEVAAIVVPAPRGSDESALPRLLPKSTMLSADYLPLLEADFNPNIIHLGWQRQIPVWEVGRLAGDNARAMLAGLQPDLVAVACFPRRFPAWLLGLPRFGCLNLHPSLLPAYRGPEPLFWIARNDERVTGVTLHLLADGLDSGDIIAQRRFERGDGTSGAELESRCAAEGAALLVETIGQLLRGAPLPRRPQDEAEASYYPAPTAGDLTIPAYWPARRAFNFARGAEGWPLTLEIGDACFRLRAVKSFAANQTLERPVVLLGDEVWVQFTPGVLRARIWPPPPDNKAA